MIEPPAFEWLEKILEPRKETQAKQWLKAIALLKRYCPPNVLRALGYASGRGVSSVAERESLDRRDAAIREWHRSTGENSQTIEKKLSDFGSRIWCSYKTKSEMPGRFCGEWQEFAWRVYHAKPSSLSARQIQRILIVDQTDIK